MSDLRKNVKKSSVSTTLKKISSCAEEGGKK